MTGVGLLLVAAGRGERLGKPETKALVPLLDRPLLSWALEAFASFAQIEERVVLTPPGEEPAFREAVSGFDKVQVLAGGETRQESVRRGLAALGEGAHWVLVHDAARPLLTPRLVGRVLEVLEGGESVVLALPLRDSVARMGFESWIKDYEDRGKLLAIQTPQGFHRPVLEFAHRRALEDGETGTDDASLVLRLNHAVSWIEGEAENLKITYPGDLAVAEAVLRSRKGAGSPAAS
jgi:2-C-methyl-D-erythritol 4-phosphate cytidylyltransferase